MNCPFVPKMASVTTIYFVTKVFVNPNTGQVYIFSQHNSVFKLEDVDLLVEIKH